MRRVMLAIALSSLAACQRESWDEVDAWAANLPVTRVLDSEPGRTYVMPNVGQFGSVAFDDSFVVIRFESPRFRPQRLLTDVDCKGQTATAYSTESISKIPRVDYLGDEVRDADGKLFRFAFESPLKPDEYRVFCKRDWSAEKRRTREAMRKLRGPASS